MFNKITGNKKNFGWLSELPKELIDIILSFLPQRELFKNIQLVNLDWRRFVYTPWNINRILDRLYKVEKFELFLKYLDHVNQLRIDGAKVYGEGFLGYKRWQPMPKLIIRILGSGHQVNSQKSIRSWVRETLEEMIEDNKSLQSVIDQFRDKTSGNDKDQHKIVFSLIIKNVDRMTVFDIFAVMFRQQYEYTSLFLESYLISHKNRKFFTECIIIPLLIRLKNKEVVNFFINIITAKKDVIKKSMSHSCTFCNVLRRLHERYPELAQRFFNIILREKILFGYVDGFEAYFKLVCDLYNIDSKYAEQWFSLSIKNYIGNVDQLMKQFIIHENAKQFHKILIMVLRYCYEDKQEDGCNLWQRLLTNKQIFCRMGQGFCYMLRKLNEINPKFALEFVNSEYLRDSEILNRVFKSTMDYGYALGECLKLGSEIAKYFHSAVKSSYDCLKEKTLKQILIDVCEYKENLSLSKNKFTILYIKQFDVWVTLLPKHAQFYFYDFGNEGKNEALKLFLQKKLKCAYEYLKLDPIKMELVKFDYNMVLGNNNIGITEKFPARDSFMNCLGQIMIYNLLPSRCPRDDMNSRIQQFIEISKNYDLGIIDVHHSNVSFNIPLPKM